MAVSDHPWKRHRCHLLPSPWSTVEEGQRFKSKRMERNTVQCSPLDMIWSPPSQTQRMWLSSQDTHTCTHTTGVEGELAEWKLVGKSGKRLREVRGGYDFNIFYTLYNCQKSLSSSQKCYLGIISNFFVSVTVIGWMWKVLPRLMHLIIIWQRCLGRL